MKKTNQRIDNLIDNKHPNDHSTDRKSFNVAKPRGNCALQRYG